MAKTAQDIFIPTDLPGQILQSTGETGLTADNIDIFQSSDMTFYREIGSKHIYTTKAKIREMTGPNPNVIYIVTDNKYKQSFVYNTSDQTGSDNTGTILETADGKLLKDYYHIFNPINILAFGASEGQDSTAAFKAAIENAPVQRTLIIPKTTNGFIITDTININAPIRIIGKTFSIGNPLYTSVIYYKGPAGQPAFKISYPLITIENITIAGVSSDPAYQNFNGIELNYGGSSFLKNISILYATKGIYINTTQESDYITLDTVCVESCSGEGIYIANTGIASNAIKIISPHINNCTKGIYLGQGTGCDIYFGGTEIGSNSVSDIELAGGNWRLRGSMWGEGSPIGIVATGGFHTVEGDIKGGVNFYENGGTIICDSAQWLVDAPRLSNNYDECKFWFSFDEETGSVAHSRSGNKILTLTSQAVFGNSGQFKTSLNINGGQTDYNIATLNDVSDISLTNDWTILCNLVNNWTDQGSKFLTIKCGSSYLCLAVYGIYTYVYASSTTAIVGHNYPGQGFTTAAGWSIISYSGGQLTWYSASGNKNDTKACDLSSYPAIDLITLSKINNTDLTSARSVNNIDEIMFFQRVLDPKEIYAITHTKKLDVNNKALKPIVDTSITTPQTSSSLNILYPNGAYGQQIIAPNVSGGAMRYTLYDATNKNWISENVTTI